MSTPDERGAGGAPASQAAADAALDADAGDGPVGAVTRLHQLRVVVDRIEGRSVCGLRPGDAFTVTRSSRLSLPEGGHFCLYALAAVLPLLPAQQRAVAAGDWLATDTEVACPDPEERLIMRIERGAPEEIPSAELT